MLNKHNRRLHKRITHFNPNSFKPTSLFADPAEAYGTLEHDLDKNTPKPGSDGREKKASSDTMQLDGHMRKSSKIAITYPGADSQYYIVMKEKEALKKSLEYSESEQEETISIEVEGLTESLIYNKGSTENSTSEETSVELSTYNKSSTENPTSEESSAELSTYNESLVENSTYDESSVKSLAYEREHTEASELNQPMNPLQAPCIYIRSEPVTRVVGFQIPEQVTTHAQTDNESKTTGDNLTQYNPINIGSVIIHKKTPVLAEKPTLNTPNRSFVPAKKDSFASQLQRAGIKIASHQINNQGGRGC